jgi:endoglucanase
LQVDFNQKKKMTARVNIVMLISLVGLFYSTAVNANRKTMDIAAANKLLAKTINIGYTFDAPQEGAWGNTLTKEELKNIKSAGFTAVRIPIQWVARMDSAPPYTINEGFIKRIDEVVHEALKNHLAIIIENCLDQQLMAQPEKYKDRFLALWQQLSVHYASYPQQVMFEILAEPNGELDKVWDSYFTSALDIIRKNNLTRPVIIGPQFSNMPFYINSLHLPENDRYIILTFHLYKPTKFTMQGEKWFPFGKPMEWIGTKWTGTPEEQKEITDNMDLVDKWATTHNRPVFMGEFGASNIADMDSKIKFLTFYREQAEKRNFSWGVWSYNVGFSIFDNSTGQWHTGLLKALIPAG